MLKLTESGPVTGRQTPTAAHLYTVNNHTNLICTHTGSRMFKNTRVFCLYLVNISKRWIETFLTIILSSQSIVVELSLSGELTKLKFLYRFKISVKNEHLA